MVSQAEVLTEIRAHPEGITTPELAEIFCDRDSRSRYYSMRAKVNARCRMLEKYGEVRHDCITPASSGKGYYVSKWFAVEADE